MSFLSLVPNWVWAALVVALAATSCKLKLDNTGLSIEIEKGKTYVAELKSAISESNTTAAKKATELETQARQAEAAAAVRERSLRADAGRARTELDSLRAVAASYSLRPKLATGPIAPELDVADIFPELFIQCSSRLVEVAGEADQWKSDAIKLHEAWPRE